MKTLSRILISLVSFLPFLSAEAQTVRGLGRDVRAVTSTPEGLVGLAYKEETTQTTKVVFSNDEWETVVTLFDLEGYLDDDFGSEALQAIASQGSRVVVGGSDSLLFTADLGDDPYDWSPKTSESDNLFGDVFGLAASPGTWIAVGDGGILRSTDGFTWSKTLDEPTVFSSVSWVGGNTWLAVGSDGVWESTDDGLKWTDTQTAGSYTSVASDGDGNAIIVGELGTVFRYNNGDFFDITPTSLGDLRSVSFLSGNSWIIGGVERTVERLNFDSQNDPVFISLVPSVEGSFDEAMNLVVEDGVVYVAGIEGTFEDLVPDPFAIQSITIAGNTITLVQDTSTTGFSYALEYTDDLTANPQSWSEESVVGANPREGLDDEITWQIDPLPNVSVRFWRIVIVESDS